MADIIDKASDLEQHLTSAYVVSARAKARPEQVQNPDGSWPHPECIDCEATIPTGRLELGKVRCVDCQEDHERATKTRR